MQKTDVLIAGAGPTGLVLALWLARQGIKVRIIDRNTQPGQTSRAMAVQARTLELYRQLGLADAVVEAGHRNPTVNLWVRGKQRASVSLAEAGSDLTPYPFLLVYPQDQHERLLVDRLRAMGVTVERQTELLSFAEERDRVVARLRLPDGREQACEARYLAGCDGARSPIRHQLDIGFEGGTYKQVFYVADVKLSGLESGNGLHIVLDSADFVAVIPYGHDGGYRLIGTIRDERVDKAETLDFSDIDQQAIDGLGITIEEKNWFSTYRVHHRVADRFRHGRAFLLGDAAHVHSPAGGQGMNTGINDAINLAWKLAAVVKGEAPDSLLDSYEPERQAFARKLVTTTDRLFTFASSNGNFAEFVRTRLAPLFASVAFRLEGVREFMFRMVSQIMVSYPDSPLSAGTAGKVQGGDRLPFVRFDGHDNYGPLSDIGWQVHVYGDASDELRQWCRARRIALHAFPWSDSLEDVGFTRDAAYLLRPDTYVGLAEPDGRADRLEAYLAERAIYPGGDVADAG